MSGATITCADCLDWMRTQPDQSVDLVMGSSPYEGARTYGVGFKLRNQEFVDWCVVRYLECLRICKGLVCWVIEGQTRQYRYSAVPALLMADLHRAGAHLRKPPIFHRVGIPGSGGPDWLRNDYEFCICATNGGKLPWSENTAMGHPPKWAPGGAMSNRTEDGQRKNARDKPEARAKRKAHYNQWGHSMESPTCAARGVDGERDRKPRPSHRKRLGRGMANGVEGSTKGGTMYSIDPENYEPPAIANPGNVIECSVGGGAMGSDLAHLNEAPYPESLCEFFIRSFCPPGGIVFDPFAGSGTTLAVALRCGRNATGTDIRASQVELTKRRLATVNRELFT